MQGTVWELRLGHQWLLKPDYYTHNLMYQTNSVDYHAIKVREEEHSKEESNIVRKSTVSLL